MDFPNDNSTRRIDTSFSLSLLAQPKRHKTVKQLALNRHTPSLG